MPTPHPLRRLLAPTLALLTTALPHIRAQQAEARWSPNLLPEGSVQRVAAGESIALPQPAADKLPEHYEVRLAATRLDGTGSLSVLLRDGSGELVELFPAAKAEPGRLVLCWTVANGRIEAGEGTSKATAGKANADKQALAQDAAWSARGNDAIYRLDRLQWRRVKAADDARAAAKGDKAADKVAVQPAVAKPATKADLMTRLAARDRWVGTVDADRGKPMDCTLVVIERSASKLVFRLENERGGWHRFECSVENGKLRVDRVVHTRNANGGARAEISDEKGQGRLVGDRLQLDYTFTNRFRGSKNTVTGRIVVDLAPQQ